MTASRELKTEETSTATGIQRIKRLATGGDEGERQRERRSPRGPCSPDVRMLWPKPSSKFGARRPQWAATWRLTTSVSVEFMQLHSYARPTTAASASSCSA